MESALIPLTAIICTIGLPVYVWYRLRMRRLELEERTGGGAPPAEIERLESENVRLHERVQNLESIVLNVDFELNQRLLRLAENQSRLLPGPGSAEQAAATGGTDLLEVVASAPALSLPFTRGDLVGERYEIEAEVGRGGMGIVYRAHDRELGERVALKVIAPHLSSDTQVAERFKREVGAARRVTHPNVIRIHDLGQADGRLFLSMEWFPGRSLEEQIPKNAGLSLAVARMLLLQVCDGLEAAHRAGVIHRDLKPTNILVGDDRTVKLIDFGLASATGAAGLTATGLLVGTPAYMAPEQVRGAAQDERTDIYALGVVLYHALCGVLPFQAPNPIALGFAHLSEVPPPPRSRRPDLPLEVERVILRALAKEPHERFPRVRDLRAALEESL